MSYPQYRVHCVRIVPRAGGVVVRLTDHPVNLTTLTGEVYSSISGYQFTGLSTTDGFSPSSIDIEGIADIAGIARSDVARGMFDGAWCYVFSTAWNLCIEDHRPLISGKFGKTTMLDGRYTITGTSLVDLLRQVTGETYTESCRKVFLSQSFAGCMVPIEPNTVTGSLTSVTSKTVFTDSTRSEGSDVFGAGTIAFTTGANVSQGVIGVKSHQVGGVIETYDALYYTPTIGDQYTMTRGCRKTADACKNRVGNSGPMSNIINFNGFMHIPPPSKYGKVGTG